MTKNNLKVVKSTKDQEMDVKEKTKALDAAIAQITDNFGKGSVMKLGEKRAMDIESVSTGSLSLDLALGIGGLPKGRIIVLVSMSGKRSKGDLAAYSSSKFALMGLCQTMKNKGWDKNIRVSAICPSWVNTKMAQNISSLDKSSMTQPEDIAEICSTILKLPTQSVPFEIALNCNYEI